MKNTTKKTLASTLVAAALAVGVFATTAAPAAAAQVSGSRSCSSSQYARLTTTRTTHGIPINTSHQWDSNTGPVQTTNSTSVTMTSIYTGASGGWYSAVTGADGFTSYRSFCGPRPVL